MYKKGVFVFVLLFCCYSYSQEQVIDNNYREDQIYVGLFYNSLKETPSEFNQIRFSNTINFGFIRDIPLNKNRNRGIGIGLGFSTSSFHNNLKFSKINNQFDANLILDSKTYKKNKWTINELEFPFELRWRTSTAESYKFWRIYFGLKISYIISSRAKYESDSSSIIVNNLPFNKFQSGFTLNAGNNTWNLGVYFGLNPIFNDDFTKKNQNLKNLKQFKVGLIFYIF
jgi:hypothetical protein